MVRTVVVLALLLAGSLLPAAASSAAVVATSAQQNEQRTQFAAHAGVAPPLAVAWRRDDRGRSVVAAGGGRVFTLGAPDPGMLPPNQREVDAVGPLEALDARTGATLWSLPTQGPVHAVLTGDRLVLVRREEGVATLTVVAAATGAVQWQIRRPDLPLAVPGVADGRIHVNVLNAIETFRLTDGAPLWKTPLRFTESAGLVVAGGRIFLGAQQRAFIVDAATGAVVVAQEEPVNASSRRVTSVDGALVFSFDSSGTIDVQSAADGRPVGILNGFLPPAVARGWAFSSWTGEGYLRGYVLRAGGPVEVWRAGPGWSLGPLLFADDTLFGFDDTKGCLSAVDAQSGRTVWRSDPLARPGAGSGLTGPLTADGRVYVGTGEGLVALRSAPGAPSGSCPDHPVQHLPAYDPNERLAPLPAARPTGTAAARRLRGGRVRVTVTGVSARRRVRVTVRCGRRVARASRRGPGSVTVRLRCRTRPAAYLE